MDLDPFRGRVCSQLVRIGSHHLHQPSEDSGASEFCVVTSGIFHKEATKCPLKESDRLLKRPRKQREPERSASDTTLRWRRYRLSF